MTISLEDVGCFWVYESRLKRGRSGDHSLWSGAASTLHHLRVSQLSAFMRDQVKCIPLMGEYDKLLGPQF